MQMNATSRDDSNARVSEIKNALNDGFAASMGSPAVSFSEL
jgi:hypothetical protein